MRGNVAVTEAQDDMARRTEARAREQEVSDLSAVLSSREGRRFYWRLLGKSGVFEASWDPSARIHFNEGRRSVGLHLLAEVTTEFPDAYLLMQSEAVEDAKRAEAEAMALETETEDDDNG